MKINSFYSITALYITFNAAAAPQKRRRWCICKHSYIIHNNMWVSLLEKINQLNQWSTWWKVSTATHRHGQSQRCQISANALSTYNELGFKKKRLQRTIRKWWRIQYEIIEEWGRVNGHQDLSVTVRNTTFSRPINSRPY